MFKGPKAFICKRISPNEEHRCNIELPLNAAVMPEGNQSTRMLEQFAEMGRWDRLLDMGKEVLAHDPENERVHQLVGLAALNEGELKLARRHIEFATGANPDDPFPHYLQGKLCEKENRPLFAKKHFLDALMLDPLDPGYFVAYGWNCLQRGDFRSGYNAALEARKIDPENADAASLLTTAESELETGTLGDGKAQIDAYESILALDPEDDTLHFQIGRTWLYEENDVDAAEPRLRQALRMDPGNKVYQKAMLEVVRRRDPVLKILHSPWRFITRTYRELDRLGANTDWKLIIKVPVAFFKLFGAMILLPFWALFFAPPAVFYEWKRKDAMLIDASIDPSTIERADQKFSPRAIGIAVIALLMVGVLASTVWWLFSVPGFRDQIGDILGGLMILLIVGGATWSAKRQNK
ncbi:MAG: hypothetical protein AAGA58_10705 [Verrucomicrobiota bacterium]